MEFFDNKLDAGIVVSNLFGKVWEQTEATIRLVVTYFNWIWIHSRKKNTAAMRAGLATAPWNWDDLITYPTLL
ncbi:MAG: hypothetical protein F6K57_37480 [Moorea sp. SIO4A5]|nr:hypothetical protein [Moorena sp. SIO4A5]